MIVFDSGDYLESSGVSVSPLSDAFLYGKMSFTTLLGWNGRFLGPELHLQRLYAMAAQEGGDFSFQLDQLQTVLANLCAKNGIQGWTRARIMIWRESEWRLLVEVSSFSREKIDKKRESGVVLGVQRADLCIDPWGYSSCKGYGYITRLRAAQGKSEDSLWIDERGRVGECGTCTPIYYWGGKFYVNNRQGLLRSVTVQLLAGALARFGFELIELEIEESMVVNAESVFIASSLRWCLPVRSILGLADYDINMGAWEALLGVQENWRQTLQMG